MSATYFACGRPKRPRCASSCERYAAGECEFELRGSKAGQICGHSVCENHSKVVAGKRLCLAHARFAAVAASRSGT